MQAAQVVQSQTSSSLITSPSSFFSPAGSASSWADEASKWFFSFSSRFFGDRALPDWNAGQTEQVQQVFAVQVNDLRRAEFILFFQVDQRDLRRDAQVLEKQVDGPGQQVQVLGKHDEDAEGHNDQDVQPPEEFRPE
jgi:hypothetical protein